MTPFRSSTHAPIPQQILHYLVLSLTYSILHFYMHRSHVIHAHFDQLLKPHSCTTLTLNNQSFRSPRKPLRDPQISVISAHKLGFYRHFNTLPEQNVTDFHHTSSIVSRILKVQSLIIVTCPFILTIISINPS